MAIDSVSAVTSANATASTKGTGQAEEMGQDTFLQLLLAQLQNQDPLKPMDDTEFIAQLAQFNSLNQLTAISETLTGLMDSQTFSQANAMIGKTVSGLSSEHEQITGEVLGVYVTDGNINLDLGDGTIVSMNSVYYIKETPADTSDESGE